jgi:hypothetical protein
VANTLKPGSFELGFFFARILTIVVCPLLPGHDEAMTFDNRIPRTHHRHMITRSCASLSSKK